MSNVLSGAIKRAGDKAMYNDYCKEILSCKQILARILQETTDEFKRIPIEKVQECIEKYHISKEKLVGDTPDNLENYDKMVMVFVYLNSNCEDKCELTEMLNVLFSKKVRVEEKIKRLKEKYGIILEDDEKEVLRDMCDFAELLIEEVTEEVTAEVTAKVTAKVTAESVRNAAKMAKVLGTNEELIPSIISENYNISVDEVKAILCA